MLPGDTYVKGFLRTYADYLGLEGQLYLDEYNSRFTTAEEVPVAQSTAPKRRSRPVESNFVVVALAGIVAVTVLVVVGLARSWAPTPQNEPPIVPATTGQTTTESTATDIDGRAGDRCAGPGQARAARPDGGAGRLLDAGARRRRQRQAALYEGTVEQGQTQRFVKYKRLWLELGAPGNLNAKLNGRRLQDWPTRSSIIVVTAAQGVQTLSTAG